MKSRLTVALALASLPAFAQTLDRTKPPAQTPPHPYKLPAVFETKLPNGLTILLADDARVPLATVRLVFHGGYKRDPKDIPGLAGAVSGMLMQGTATRTYQQIAEQLDGLGASMGAATDSDSIAIRGSILAENLPAMLELMADVARNASFPETELTLYRQNRKQGYLAQHSQPAVLATEEFQRRVFGDHPYAHVGPTLPSIDKMDRAAIASYRDTFLVPNNAYLIIVGKLPERAQLVRTLTAQFGSWQQKAVPDYKPGAPPAPKKQLVLVDRPGSVQADVRMGKLGATYRDPEFFPESVGSIVLGSGMSSRLFNDIREKRGFAYDVHTEVVPSAEAGTFATVTQVRNEVAGDALQAIVDHLDRMGKEPVAAEELSSAKSFASGLYVLRLEPQAGLADQLARIRIMGLPKDYLETYITKINSVEPDQIQKASKKFIASEDETIVVVGDAAKLGPVLEKLGKFEVVKPN